MKPLISVIIPVYNSEKSIGELICKLNILSRESELFSLEVVLMDDCSRDDSYRICKELDSKYEIVKAYKLVKNRGQQNATYAAMHKVSGDYVLTMDDDLQHKVEMIEVLFEKICEGLDLVYAVNSEEESSPLRNFGSKLRSKLFKTIFPILENNKVSSFRIFTRELNDSVLGVKNEFVYVSGLLLSKHPRVYNIKIDYNERKYGKSNYTLKKLFVLFKNLMIYYSNIRVLSRFKKINEPFKLEEERCS